EYPAAELATLYARRWEIEIVFDEIKAPFSGRAPPATYVRHRWNVRRKNIRPSGGASVRCGTSVRRRPTGAAPAACTACAGSAP
ncbi:transposase, partial [Streptomyces mirabilis]|uniref:transposase n=1 Tax=Streptomyces mirabilis TaxID=68239 RepID=UPI0033E60E7C